MHEKCQTDPYWNQCYPLLDMFFPTSLSSTDINCGFEDLTLQRCLLFTSTGFIHVIQQFYY